MITHNILKVYLKLLKYDKILLKKGKFILSKPFNRDGHYLQLLDESFNVVSKHFETIPYNNSGMDYRINNDTIRFVFSPVNQIFSFYGDTEQITELVVPIMESKVDCPVPYLLSNRYFMYESFTAITGILSALS